MGKQSRAKRHAAGEEAVPEEPAHPGISPWTILAIFAGLSIISFVHFLPSLEGKFVNWDDKWNFVENADFGPVSDPAAVRWMWTNMRGHYMLPSFSSASNTGIDSIPTSTHRKFAAEGMYSSPSFASPSWRYCLPDLFICLLVAANS